ncbi:site-2 protease family protein [Candidatus Omnitrophota bacterium]
MKNVRIFSMTCIIAFVSLASVVHAGELEIEQLYKQAVTASHRRNYEESLKFLAELFQRDPLNLEAHTLQLYNRLGRGEQLEDIQQKHEQQLIDNPQDIVSLYCLSFIAFAKKDTDQAEDYLLRARRINPDIVAIYTALVRIELSRENLEGAKEYFDAARAIDPDSYFVDLVAGRYHLEVYVLTYDRSAIALAKQELEKSQKKRPYTVQPYLSLGYAYLADGEYDQAVAMYAKALEMDRFDSFTNFFYGMLLVQNGEYKKARSHFLTAQKYSNEIDKHYMAEEIDTRLEVLSVEDHIYPVIISVFGFFILIISVIIHEYMHGFLAYKCGDPTAKNAGRLSFNPIAHIDLTGSIILPLILVVTKAPFLIGWAKPVPINPRNFKNPRKDDMIISAAGPLSNIALGVICIALVFICGVIFKTQDFKTLGFGLYHTTVLVSAGSASVLWTYVINILRYGVIINFVLAGLNLIPIPPLDGSHIAMGLLPFQWVRKIYGKLARAGMIILLILVVTGMLSFLLIPVLLILSIVFGVMGTVLGLG